MAWLKRNLILVVGGVIALALLALAGFFLYTKIQLNAEVTAQLDQSTEQLKTLVSRDPHPGTEGVDNIGTAKEEHKKLEAFLNDVKKYFPPYPTNSVSNREFRALLDNTVDVLQRNATKAGVGVPKDYWFTFAAQKTSVNFPTNVIGPLSAQLAEIRALSEILFDAKVVSLVGFKRVAVATEDVGATDYLTVKGATNDVAVVTPYEITFDGFSTELADVLEGLIRTTNNCFVVKNVIVQQAPEDRSLNQTPTPQYNPYPGRAPSPLGSRYGGRYGAGSRYGGGGGMDPSLAQRYGVAPQAQAPAPVARPGKGGLTTVLDEKMLRVTLSVDAIKLKPVR